MRLKLIVLLNAVFHVVDGFQSSVRQQTRCHRGSYSINRRSVRLEESRRSQPRTGFGQQVLDWVLASPLWKHVLVPQARATVVKTAQENDIPWTAAKEWLNEKITRDLPVLSREYPDYYERAFHAYEDGNLSWEAAIEQELASRAIGARNFPAFGERGEDVFRDAFDRALAGLGGFSDVEGVIVDFGCGTGCSTRRLAARHRSAAGVIGIDLSPYFVHVGTTLLQLAPRRMSSDVEEGWITAVERDERIELRQGDMASCGLPSGCAAVVNMSLVLHELPADAARQALQEAFRILAPGGQLWISEMDFDSPAYKKQRDNALLFSLLRATEPYLDDYADGMDDLRRFLSATFAADQYLQKGTIRIAAATGRHYALLAQKGHLANDLQAPQLAPILDYRFHQDGSYAVQDTHLKPWESKS